MPSPKRAGRLARGSQGIHIGFIPRRANVRWHGTSRRASSNSYIVRGIDSLRDGSRIPCLPCRSEVSMRHWDAV
ncbi:hypothetical protein KC367_g16 [Hortaea werneckii]|nr:hypothetical protein KC367_g16 [Hortaea werneckii]